jgi:hypothetical protein
MTTIYRHKFAPTTIEHMDYFAKLHKNDDRKTFKEAWERWTNDNSEMIETEKRLHSDAGYKGDVINKMYKSVRYYYRKKTVEITTEKKEQRRRDYVALDRDLLREMDVHIEKNRTIKPAAAFNDFCENNKEHIKNEALRLKDYLQITEISEKIKKTYKNRHFNTVNSEKE